MSLSDLVASAGRNKRAKAVQFFRDGLSFLSKDDCEKALPYFEKAVESDSNYAEAWAQTGFCNEKLGRHAEAIEASKKAVSLRPSAESYFNIGLASYYLKQYRDAAEAYRQAIRLDPYNAADAYYALGLVYRDWGKADEEIQAYKQAIRQRPDYIVAYERLGSRYLRSKKFSEAIEIFRQLAALKPGDACCAEQHGRSLSGVEPSERRGRVLSPINPPETRLWQSLLQPRQMSPGHGQSRRRARTIHHPHKHRPGLGREAECDNQSLIHRLHRFKSAKSVDGLNLS